MDRDEKWSDLWYIFKPTGFEKTLAEMDAEERENRRAIDGSYSALEKFAEWYKENDRILNKELEKGIDSLEKGEKYSSEEVYDELEKI
jgi:hypothetical protein